MIADVNSLKSKSEPSFIVGTVDGEGGTENDDTLHNHAATEGGTEDWTGSNSLAGSSGSADVSVEGLGGGTILMDPTLTLPASPRQFFSNKMSCRLQSSMSALDKKGKMYSKFYAHDPNDPNIKRVLEAVAGDHAVATNPQDNKNRRTVVLNRQNDQSYGMALMSYIIRMSDSQMYRINYVDNVEIGSVAQMAGVRAGDIILSINGHSVVDEDHVSIVNHLKQCTIIRLVLLFDNCVHKIDLCSRAYKLKAMIEDKKLDLKMLEINEQRILSGQKPLPHSELLRSVLSNDMRDIHVDYNGSFDSSSLSLDLGVEYESCGSCSDVPSSPETQPTAPSWALQPVVDDDLTTPSSENQAVEITRL